MKGFIEVTVVQDYNRNPTTYKRCFNIRYIQSFFPLHEEVCKSGLLADDNFSKRPFYLKETEEEIKAMIDEATKEN